MRDGSGASITYSHTTYAGDQGTALKPFDHHAAYLQSRCKIVYANEPPNSLCKVLFTWPIIRNANQTGEGYGTN